MDFAVAQRILAENPCKAVALVKSNMVYSGVGRWYTIHSLAIFR